jgi:mono/diheme cytochrome c family protein
MIGNTRRLIAGSLGLFLIAFPLFRLRVIAGAIAQRSSAKSTRIDAAELFRNNCARCHGADGRGDTPLGQTYLAPDFTDGEWWRKNSAITSTRSLTAIVSRGKGQMPAFGKKLKASEITALVNHIRRFRPQ